MRALVHTPWGYADHMEVIAEGITFYSTPSHGGFKLSPSRNAGVPKEFRNTDAWYEEDCEALKVFYTYPSDFMQVDHEDVMRGLRHWFNAECVRVLGFEMAMQEACPLE